MTVTVKSFVNPKYMETAQTTQYSPTAARAKIGQFTVTNNDSVNRFFSVNILPPSGSVSNANRFVVNKTLQPGETYGCPELIGMIVDAGGAISTTASAANALSMSVSGWEIT